MKEGIVKTPGPDEDGISRGHCYDGAGWDECPFWYRGANSMCKLFNQPKQTSLALLMCDKIYGVKYTGRV